MPHTKPTEKSCGKIVANTLAKVLNPKFLFFAAGIIAQHMSGQAQAAKTGDCIVTTGPNGLFESSSSCDTVTHNGNHIIIKNNGDCVARFDLNDGVTTGISDNGNCRYSSPADSAQQENHDILTTILASKSAEPGVSSKGHANSVA